MYERVRSQDRNADLGVGSVCSKAKDSGCDGATRVAVEAQYDLERMQGDDFIVQHTNEDKDQKKRDKHVSECQKLLEGMHLTSVDKKKKRRMEDQMGH